MDTVERQTDAGEVYASAADVVHAEARWCLEQERRGEKLNAVDALLSVERILRSRSSGRRRFTLGRDDTSHPRHKAVCAWLEANGLDRSRVPIDATAVIDGDELTVDVFEEDRRIVTTQTVPLLEQPSPLVLGEI